MLTGMVFRFSEPNCLGLYRLKQIDGVLNISIQSTSEHVLTIEEKVVFLPGDVNCDCGINSLDIDPFVSVLTGSPPYDSYYDSYPDCDHMLADINSDGVVNGFDIDLFIQLLTGG